MSRAKRSQNVTSEASAIGVFLTPLPAFYTFKKLLNIFRQPVSIGTYSFQTLKNYKRQVLNYKRQVKRP